jgi:hypothetical protein
VLADPTVVATAPAIAAEPSAPVVEKTLQQFRAELAQPVAPLPDPAPVVETPAPVAPVSPLAAAPEPDEPPDQIDAAPNPADVKAPEQGANHRWKDPETGIVLDMRRKDHRRMKRALEERHAFAQQVLEARAPQPSPTAPEPTREAPRAQSAPDPTDPEPQLEQFADQPDPYAAHLRAVAKWEARQEFNARQSQHAQVERVQRTSAAIAAAQTRFDAELPSVRERYPDFDTAYEELHETLARVPLPVRAPIVHRLLTGEATHDLAYFLGNHPEAVQRLVTARSPHEQQFVMGELVAQVKAGLKTAAAPVPPPQLPAAPMTPVNGGGTPATYNPATASLPQFRAKNGVLGGRRVSA